MANNAGPVAQLRAWLSTLGAVRPRVLRPSPVGPYSAEHAQGAVAVMPGVARNEPSAGLHLVNALAADAFRVAPGITTDLVKIDQSAYGRPGRHNVAFSQDRATGDNRVAAIDNNGTRTLIASRRSAPTMPPTTAAPAAPWGGADWRTAPSGQRGQVVAPEWGNGGAGGDRTRWRTVPPTDAANPAPGAS